MWLDPQRLESSEKSFWDRLAISNCEDFIYEFLLTIGTDVLH
jgi:hypothetical protein